MPSNDSYARAAASWPLGFACSLSPPSLLPSCAALFLRYHRHQTAFVPAVTNIEMRQ